jgi:micrococcal nuclease
MVNGQNVNLEMVRLGYAWHYLKYSKDNDLAEAEKEAREGKRGLWVDRVPVPPWDWRRK